MCGRQKAAQKALQGSETEARELLGGTEENSVFLTGGNYFAGKSMFLYQKKTQKIELVSG